MSIEIGAVKIKDGFFIGDIYSARVPFAIYSRTSNSSC